MCPANGLLVYFRSERKSFEAILFLKYLRFDREVSL